MGDKLAKALVDRGYRVRVYCPYGELLPGMAYLIRRLLENTANSSFLRQNLEDRPVEELLAPPVNFGLPIADFGLESNEGLKTVETNDQPNNPKSKIQNLKFINAADTGLCRRVRNGESPASFSTRAATVR